MSLDLTSNIRRTSVQPHSFLYLCHMFRYLLPVFLIALVSSCDEPDIVSSELIPASDQPGVVFSDTASIRVYTLKDDSLSGISPNVPMYLGAHDDQEVGQTYASFYIQMTPGANPPATTWVADSIVLQLAVANQYGDSTARHEISVYRMTEPLVSGTTYYTTDTFTTESALTGYTVTAKSDVIRVRLNKALADSIMLKYAADTSLLTSSSVFLSWFHGLYIKDQAEFRGSGDIRGSILALNPSSASNKVTMYFSEPTGDVVQNRTFDFSLGQTSLRSNRVIHNYKPQVLDTTITQSTVYVQSLAGLKIRMSFPHLEDYIKDHAIAINRAELKISVKSGSDQVIDNHPYFIIYEKDSATAKLPIIDYPAGILSGNLVDVVTSLAAVCSQTDNVYTINISRQVQKMLNGSADEVIYISDPFRILSAGRTALNADGSMKLNLTYTIKNN
jgi:hypothetical protein